MNDIMKVGDTINAKETMSSLEIAELTGKQHSHVMRDIRAILEQGVNESNFGLVNYKDLKGENRPMYNLTKKGCLILSSGYDALLRERIINRWEELELEKRVLFKVPTTFAEALRFAAEKQEEVERQQKLLEEQAPKAEYFDALVDRKLNINFRDTAKELGIKEKDFIQFLMDKQYIHRDKKKQIKPIASYVEKGIFEIKEWSNEHKTGNQTLIAPKGRENFKLLMEGMYV